MDYYVIYENSPRCKGGNLFLATPFGGVTNRGNLAQRFPNLATAQVAANAFPDSNMEGHEPAKVVLGELILHVRDIR